MAARHPTWIFCLATVMVAASCTSAVAQAASSSDRGRTISGPDIYLAGGSSAYDGVWLLDRTLLRPQATSIRTAEKGPAVVYVNGIRRNSLEVLRTVHVREIRTMTYLRGPEAFLRYGANHDGGAVIVVTHAGR